VLAHQHRRQLGGEAADDLPLGVNEIPLGRDLSRFGHVRLHRFGETRFAHATAFQFAIISDKKTPSPPDRAAAFGKEKRQMAQLSTTEGQKLSEFESRVQPQTDGRNRRLSRW
jgi:hypothetical protein